MPVNAPAEYYAAEERFRSAKNKDERIAALEEMIRLLPKHHGSEVMYAQLKSRLAKLRKVAEKGQGKSTGIKKEGDSQICLLGFTRSGKSTILSALTDAKPEIAKHDYTTTKPEIGMMDCFGIKIQIIELPATFKAEYLSITRSCDVVALVVNNADDEDRLKEILKRNFIRTKTITISLRENMTDIKNRLWDTLSLIVVYSKKTMTPMALKRGSNVWDFTNRIHKDFLDNFNFARLWRNGIISKVGLDYKLQNKDVIEIHTK